MLMYCAPFRACEYTTYAIIAWYSRARSSLRRSMSCSRVIASSAISLSVVSPRVRLPHWLGSPAGPRAVFAKASPHDSPSPSECHHHSSHVHGRDGGTDARGTAQEQLPP